METFGTNSWIINRNSTHLGGLRVFTYNPVPSPRLLRARSHTGLAAMPRPVSRRHLLRAVLPLLPLAGSGCGTILYPERRGQPAGRIDWGVVALDAVGLLFFFVPGVIAFAVDFSTGAIYLPPGRYSAYRAPRSHDPELARIAVPPEQLTREHIEQVVSDHTLQPVRLQRDTYESRPLTNVSEFWATHDELSVRST